MAIQIVNEKTTAYLTYTLLDKNNAPAAPVSATYQIDNADTGASIRVSTALGAVASAEITLDKNDNTMQDQSTDYERHEVTINAVYSALDELHSSFIYKVRNLHKVS